MKHTIEFWQMVFSVETLDVFILVLSIIGAVLVLAFICTTIAAFFDKGSLM